MVSFSPSRPASAYSLARSSSDLKVPSSLAALLHGTLMAPGMCPARWLCSCGRCAGARILPENSSGERTSTRFFSPMAAMTSSRNARMVLSGVLGGVAGRRPVHRVGGQRPAVELPLLAAAVEQLDLVVPVQLEVPVRVCGEPVVVAAVEDHGVVVADAPVGQQLRELLGVDEVALDVVLQIGLPVQLDGAVRCGRRRRRRCPRRPRRRRCSARRDCSRPSQCVTRTSERAMEEILSVAWCFEALCG